MTSVTVAVMTARSGLSGDLSRVRGLEICNRGFGSFIPFNRFFHPSASRAKKRKITSTVKCSSSPKPTERKHCVTTPWGDGVQNAKLDMRRRVDTRETSSFEAGRAPSLHARNFLRIRELERRWRVGRGMVSFFIFSDLHYSLH